MFFFDKSGLEHTEYAVIPLEIKLFRTVCIHPEKLLFSLRLAVNLGALILGFFDLIFLISNFSWPERILGLPEPYFLTKEPLVFCFRTILPAVERGTLNNLEISLIDLPRLWSSVIACNFPADALGAMGSTLRIKYNDIFFLAFVFNKLY